LEFFQIFKQEEETAGFAVARRISQNSCTL